MIATSQEFIRPEMYPREVLPMPNSPYHLAQCAISDLKQAVLEVISNGPEEGIANAEIGRN